MSVNPTVAEVLFLVSNAQVWTALSIWRRLLMQAFFCDCVRARTKLGIAIAASKPMMATTIMISTSVNPCLFDVLFFILTLSFCFCGVNNATSGLLLLQLSFTDCLLRPHLGFKQAGCQSVRGRRRLLPSFPVRQKGLGLLPGPVSQQTGQLLQGLVQFMGGRSEEHT